MFQFHVRPSKRDASGDASKRAGQLIFQTQRSHSSTRTRSISLVRSGCRRTKIGKRQFRTDFHRTFTTKGANRRERPVPDSDFAISGLNRRNGQLRFAFAPPLSYHSSILVNDREYLTRYTFKFITNARKSS